ncbi:MAG: hypothetical protein KF830_16735 [Planctomycetes bacterium]|nr:hypothetical protein [Planctomycetota bacterium]
MRLAFLLGSVLACLPLQGCIVGAIYQSTIEPLDLNLRETPSGSTAGASDVKDLNLVYARIVWDGNDIAGAAKKAGITRIHHADIELFNVLGIWRQYWVHVYGE